jgi:hypothetical protein
LTAAKRNLEIVTAPDGATPPEYLAKEVELLEAIDHLHSQEHAGVKRVGGAHLADAA